MALIYPSAVEIELFPLALHPRMLAIVTNSYCESEKMNIMNGWFPAIMCQG